MCAEPGRTEPWPHTNRNASQNSLPRSLFLFCFIFHTLQCSMSTFLYHFVFCFVFFHFFFCIFICAANVLICAQNHICLSRSILVCISSSSSSSFVVDDIGIGSRVGTRRPTSLSSFICIYLFYVFAKRIFIFSPSHFSWILYFAFTCIPHSVPFRSRRMQPQARDEMKQKLVQTANAKQTKKE